MFWSYKERKKRKAEEPERPEIAALGSIINTMSFYAESGKCAKLPQRYVSRL